jgi:hypothetical protein
MLRVVASLYYLASMIWQEWSQELAVLRTFLAALLILLLAVMLLCLLILALPPNPVQ